MLMRCSFSMRENWHLQLMRWRKPERCYSRAEGYLQATSPVAFRTIINAGLGMCALKQRRAWLRRGTGRQSWPSYLITGRSIRASWPHLKPGCSSGVESQLQQCNCSKAVSTDVRDRFVTAWIKLSLETARFLRSRCFGRSFGPPEGTPPSVPGTRADGTNAADREVAAIQVGRKKDTLGLNRP